MSVTANVHLGPVLPEHRERLESMVRATRVFAEDEVAVAMELFDETIRDAAIGDGRPNRHDPRPAEPDYEFVGAFEGDDLVGYACYGATPSTDNTYDLYWIVVHPDSQGSGAGSLLMSEVEDRLRARRARLLVVETSSRADYEPTRRFYEKRGYGRSAQVRDFYAPGDHRVILTKDLG